MYNNNFIAVKFEKILTIRCFQAFLEAQIYHPLFKLTFLLEYGSFIFYITKIHNVNN